MIVLMFANESDDRVGDRGLFQSSKAMRASLRMRKSRDGSLASEATISTSFACPIVQAA